MSTNSDPQLNFENQVTLEFKQEENGTYGYFIHTAKVIIKI